GSTTPCSASTQHWALNTATQSNVPKNWSYGKPSSVTSSMARKSSSTSSSPRRRKSGVSTPPLCCCCHTATRVRAQTTPRHASNASCRCLQKKTCSSCSPPTVQTTSTCCANTPTRPRVVHWSSSARSSCCVYVPLLQALKTSRRDSSCR